MFSLFCECIHLEYVRIHVIYRGNQAEHVIHIRVVAPQEYVNVSSTCRFPGLEIRAQRAQAKRVPIQGMVPSSGQPFAINRWQYRRIALRGEYVFTFSCGAASGIQ